MATSFVLSPPPSLEIHDQNTAETWKKSLLTWNNYALSTKMNTEAEAVQKHGLCTGLSSRPTLKTQQKSSQC